MLSDGKRREVVATVYEDGTNAVLAGRLFCFGKCILGGVVCDLAVAVGEAACVPHGELVVGVVSLGASLVRFHGMLLVRGVATSVVYATNKTSQVEKGC